MLSRCIGKFPIDQNKVYSDISNLTDEDYVSDYSEFTVGSWQTAVLMNQSGDLRSGEVKEYTGSGRFTELSKKLPHITQAIEDNFDITKIKMARIATIKRNGLILPHIDFVTFSDPLKRYNIALISNESCISIEEQTAYSMRSGEIWDLDATQPHSAGNFSNEDRISLIVDLEPISDNGSYFTQQGILDPIEDIRWVDRVKLSEETVKHYYDLSKIITKHNYRDILSMVGKIPFFWDIDLADVFSIMKKICERSNDQLLIDNIIKTEQAFLHKRATDPVDDIL